MCMAEYGIIGGGVAGLSLASFLNGETILWEQQPQFGGLSRSFALNNIAFDIGPHIIFSKNKSVLDYHTQIIETNKIRRSNIVFYKDRFVKYPFENDLGALDAVERDYCLQEFLHNPYQDMPPANMQQFFLKTFGEGITKTYLQPYNEKIWKFDPAFMDTQMVERIPKPPREDVIKSASGEATEGYTHQLYFHYPKSGGFQTMINKYAELARQKGQKLIDNCHISAIDRHNNQWRITTNRGEFMVNILINCAPMPILPKILPLPADIRANFDKLLYNSIHVIIIQAKRDFIGDHFALYIPQKDIIFHRLSRINFLGSEYCLPNGGTTLMAEVTFRPDSYLGQMQPNAIVERVIDDLVKIQFVKRDEILDSTIRTEKYGYVIYDIMHRQNTDTILNHLQGMGIESSGRFAEWEYLNTDGVVEHTMALAQKLNNVKN